MQPKTAAKNAPFKKILSIGALSTGNFMKKASKKEVVIVYILHFIFARRIEQVFPHP
jgi:hypothetical protein